MLIRDNLTRWHSYYNICQRAVLLREEITHLLNTESELEKDYLRPTNWGYLTDISDFLKPFHVLTKVNEGVDDIVDQILPSIKFLLEYLEQARATYTTNHYINEQV